MHLTLFFTYGTSLKTWDKTGMLEREVALYRKYLEHGHKVSFVTYGRKDKKLFSTRLKGIEICCNSLNLPAGIYANLLPWLHAETFRNTDVIKSNQTSGALQALRVARRYRKPMVARCGYMHSEFIINQKGSESTEAQSALDDERKIFSGTDWIEVTTPMMKESIIERLPDCAGKISVIPNYVDTETFRPSNAPKDIDLLFVGRLAPQKNLPVLLEALEGLGLRTAIIGSGPQEEELKAWAKALKLDIEWLGNVPNPEIPGYLVRSKLFILPSLYEGHPKTLIEAMSSGLPVIGTNVPGIREVINHGETGWLCEPTAEEIRTAIKIMHTSIELQNQYGRNARNFAIDNYALDSIHKKEESILTSPSLHNNN